MKMTASDIRTYPKLAYYVKENLPEIINVPIIVSALNRIGQINEMNLRLALVWGSNPTLKITHIAGGYGEFTPNTNSNEIRIDKAMVEEFEAGTGKREARAGKVYLVGVTILHELVHWGDDQDGIDRAGEEGEEFEQMVYGSVIY